MDEIIAENKQMYGLKWLDSSCSFDTNLTILLYFYTSLSISDKGFFMESLIFFGNIFQKTDITSMTSLADAKEILIPYFMNRVMEPLYNESVPLNNTLFDNSSLTMQLQSEVFVLRHNFIDEADAIEFYEQAQRNPSMKLTDCMQKQAIELLNFKILVDPEFNIIDRRLCHDWFTKLPSSFFLFRSGSR